MKFLLLFVLIISTGTLAAEPGRVLLEVTEPAGVHRDGAPVHVELVLPVPVAVSAGFRLLHEGKPITAQFRPQGSGEKTSEWWLDFIAKSVPHETRKYVVEYGPNVKPGPERTRGHKLIRRNDSYVVSNAPYIDWTVPRDFRGFLRSVDFTPIEHLRPNSIGLTVQDRNGKTYQLGGAGVKSSVLRECTLTVALRGVSWKADLIFPGPVSWVELRLTIDDPENRVREAGMQLNLNLDKPDRRNRTIVELGAARTIYRSLIGTEAVELRANKKATQSWQIFRSVGGKLEPFQVASKNRVPAEGWAHVMDRKRCLAIAFDRFGEQSEDRLNIRADGVFTASKRFDAEASSNGKPQKHWKAWLHFVYFPPQQSANSDPYMMQNPMRVRQRPVKKGP